MSEKKLINYNSMLFSLSKYKKVLVLQSINGGVFVVIIQSVYILLDIYVYSSSSFSQCLDFVGVYDFYAVLRI